MPLTIKIPGANFAGSGLPKFERTIAGFPLSNIKGLYLFEDGALNGAYSSALDSSGMGNNAPLAAGAAAGVRGAQGLASTSLVNPAVFNAPGLSLGQAFSAVLVGKSDMSTNVTGAYPWWWRPSPDITTGVDSNQTNGTNREAINFDASTTNNDASVGWVHGLGYMDGTTAGLTRRDLSATGAPRFTSWFAVAFSFNPAANRYRLTFAGQSFETVNSIPGAASAGKTGTHLFGVGRWGVNTNNQPGKIGLFGLYSGEKSIADLNALVAAAKARMTLRGVTAV